jgi:hypothetical protein
MSERATRQIERFDDVVVCAKADGFLYDFDLATARQHNEGRFADIGMFAHRFQETQAVELGHVEVGNHQIRRLLESGKPRQCFFAVRTLENLAAVQLLQGGSHQGTHRTLVVDDHDSDVVVFIHGNAPACLHRSIQEFPWRSPRTTTVCRRLRLLWQP